MIAPERIAAEAQNHPTPKGKPALAWKEAARALMLREVLLQEARARRIAPALVELAEGQWETEEEALIRQLLESAIPATAIDEDELRAIYDNAPDRFRGLSLRLPPSTAPVPRAPMAAFWASSPRAIRYRSSRRRCAAWRKEAFPPRRWKAATAST
ncbi:hypothetical protein QEZ48_00700 [Aquamicrobium lusatiense]|nr:hypothetical protein [Aquamicrobium lusatiense]MDH4989347.1 hypothetical protein [Aquamicrobium lusatiense]